MIHGPAETGYLPLSEAMVNIRATLAQAERAGVIDQAARDALAGLAKDLFYHDRSYDRLLELAAQAPLPASQVAALRAWLPDGRIDQKRLDAEAMLAAMEALLASDAAPMQVDYTLEWTEMWDDATLAAAGTHDAGGGTDAWLPAAQILDELRLDPEAYGAARERALLRLLAQREALRRGKPPDRASQRAALDRLRARHGLFRRAELDHWVNARDLDTARLEQLIAEEAELADLVARTADSLDDRLLDDLRLHGDYPAARRARTRQAGVARGKGAGRAGPRGCRRHAGSTPGLAFRAAPEPAAARRPRSRGARARLPRPRPFLSRPSARVAILPARLTISGNTSGRFDHGFRGDALWHPISDLPTVAVPRVRARARDGPDLLAARLGETGSR